MKNLATLIRFPQGRGSVQLGGMEYDPEAIKQSGLSSFTADEITRHLTSHAKKFHTVFSLPQQREYLDAYQKIIQLARPTIVAPAALRDLQRHNL